MRQQYVHAMELIHRLCLWIASLCIVVITVVVPWGVFTRYVMGHGSSWPEPMAILLMIVFSMLSAAVCYRDNLHIAVLAIPDNLPPADLLSLVPKISGATFFVYGENGQPAERPVNRAFYAAARGQKEIWEVPGSGHMKGIEAQPAEYERRVVGFFDRTLRPDPGSEAQ